jgi:hypothetical protein
MAYRRSVLILAVILIYLNCLNDTKAQSLDVSKVAKSEINKDIMIWDLTNAAFQDSLWLSDTNKPWQVVSSYRRYLDTKARFEADGELLHHNNWWNIYTDRLSGLPESGAINKWNKEAIEVNFGFYDYLDMGAGSDQFEGIESDRVPVIMEHLRGVLVQIEKSTGISLRVGEGIADKNPERLSGIFISPVLTVGSGSDVRPIYYNKNVTSESYIVQLEDSFVGLVPFAPESRFGVEGFLATDEANRIEMALCRIPSRLDDPRFLTLVTECMVRSMGLVGTTMGDYASMLKQRDRLDDLDRLAEDTSVIPEFDSELLRALYCAEVKPGMGKNETLLSLLNSSDC